VKRKVCIGGEYRKGEALHALADSGPLMLIRPVEPDDLEPLYEVALLTGDAGEDARPLFKDPRLLGEVYVGPYLMLDEGIGFTVLDDEGAAAGYVLGAVDTRRFEAEAEEKWWPPLRVRYPDPVDDPATADEEMIALIHHPELASEKVVAEYPAHLHIDLLPHLQGRGLGPVLLGRLFEELRSKGVPGVHLGADPRNRRAIGFYEHLGFVHLGDEEDVVMGLRL
jgi:ribosomal protein S18 acetylase RimI-like enzyme